jgi:hypothetical protein
MYTIACTLCLMLGATACHSAPVAGQEDVAPAPVVEAPVVEASPPPLETEADRVLQHAEDQRDVVHRVHASVSVERVEPLFNKRDVRTGSMYYQRNADEPPQFAIMLEKRLIGRRLESRKKHIVYDGRWLSEIDHEKKQCIRWELCGEASDPTRLDGRFPLPIGQPREEVKQRFEVEVLPEDHAAPFGATLTKDHSVKGLRLTPRAGTPTAKDFVHIDVWYDTSNWLPVGVETLDAKDNIRRIRLTAVEINPELDESQVATLQGTIPEGEDWVLDERPCIPPQDMEP